jgi:hypothetical protein
MRTNPETITAGSTPWSYTQTNGNNFSGTTVAEMFRREYSGGQASPGYPRVKLPHYHHVVKKYILDRGKFSQYYSGEDRVNYPVQKILWSQSDDAVYKGGMNLDADDIQPSGCPYDRMTLSHDKYSLNMAIDKALDAVADRKVNLAQVFAERAQTVRMMQDTVSRVASAAWNVRRGRWKSACEALGYHPRRKPTKQFANDWLALQYGWKPLLSDVKGAAESLARSMLGNPLRFSVVGRSSYKWPDYSATRNVDFAGDFAGPFRYTYSNGRTDSKCGLTYEVTNQFIRDGQTLGITDPYTLAWELLPWSFVVDWFIPIGNFVARLNYDSGLLFVSGYTTQFTTQLGSVGPVAGTYQCRATGTDGKKFTSKLSGRDASWKHILLDRFILPAPPYPTFPQFKDPFSPVHFANALALLRGAFRPGR